MAAKKILIVDDDKTISESLAKAFSKKGFEPVLCGRANDALEKLKLSEFKAIFLDCMLPQLSGVDLGAKITQENLSDAPIYLMSGIYKDKRYIREAIQKSHATDFITKPFNIDDLFKLVEKNSTDPVEHSRPPLFRIFSNFEASTEEILRAIDTTDTIHGFDLPIIYSFLLDTGATGQLQVQEAKGDNYIISFLNRKIVNVETNHKQSYLGVLLVEKGYCTKEQVENIMRENSNKRIGERLMDANFISPHSILEVMADQLIIRLSKTIWDTSVTANFSATSDIKDGPSVETDSFHMLLHDWMYSKIPVSWLKAFYVTWMDQQITQGPHFVKIANAYDLSVFKRLPNFDKLVMSGRTVDRMLTDGNFNERDFFTAIHYLATRRMICFGGKDEIVNYDSALTRLQRMSKDFKNKDHFQILNVSRNARDNEIKQAYHELAKTFHPDRLPKDAPANVRTLTQEIFGMISTAFNALKDVPSRQGYLRQLEIGQAEDLLQAEAIFEKGKQLLKSGQAKQALECFDLALAKKFARSALNLHRIWAMIRMFEGGDKKIKIRELEASLDEVPPEDRHDGLYFFVKGLFLKCVGTLDQAKSFFDRAIAVDPDFIEARREINVIRLKQENTTSGVTNILKTDIGTLLFGKKKK